MTACPACEAPATTVWAPDEAGRYAGTGECPCGFTWPVRSKPEDLLERVAVWRLEQALAKVTPAEVT